MLAPLRARRSAGRRRGLAGGVAPFSGRVIAPELEVPAVVAALDLHPALGVLDQARGQRFHQLGAAQPAVGLQRLRDAGDQAPVQVVEPGLQLVDACQPNRS